jgi:glycosyltransferase involved in cell wall biosynthesis
MMKKILFVAHGGTLEGGGEHSLLDMVLYVKSLGIYDVHVALPEAGAFSNALKVHDIPFSTSPYKFCMNPRPDAGAGSISRTTIWFGQSLVSAYKIITSVKPDIIVSNTVVIPWFIRVAQLFNVPSICVIRELNDLRNGVDLAPDATTYLKEMAKQVTAVVFNSKYTQSDYAKYFKAMPQTTVYPVVKIDPLLMEQSMEKPLFQGRSVKMVVIGNVAPHKNQLLALKALRKIVTKKPDQVFHLTIIGAQRNLDYLRSLRSYIKKHGLSKYVTFKPYTPDPHREIIKHDILLMTSSHEAFGRVTLEGQLLSRLVVGAASAGTLEIVRDGSTGITFKPDDAADLAAVLLKAVDNQDDSSAIAKRGQDESSRKFSRQAIYEPFAELLDSDHFKNSRVDYTTSRLFGNDLFNTIEYSIRLEKDLSLAEKSLIILRPARLAYKAARDPRHALSKVRERILKKR